MEDLWGLCHDGPWSSIVCGGSDGGLDFGNLTGIVLLLVGGFYFFFAFML